MMFEDLKEGIDIFYTGEAVTSLKDNSVVTIFDVDIKNEMFSVIDEFDMLHVFIKEELYCFREYEHASRKKQEIVQSTISDISSLIDLALDTKDSEWFYELTTKMEEQQ